MKRKMELGHAGQIVTTRKTIVYYLWDNQNSITYNTVFLIAEALNHRKHVLRLYSVCVRLYYLSKMVYRGRDGLKKFTSEEYKERIFEPNAETLQEVLHILHGMDEVYSNLSYEEDFAKRIFKCLGLIETLWCKGIACFFEQIYVPELAYAFDYVVQRQGDLPEPEYQGDWSISPINYEDYNYTEGIAEYFENEMISIF